MILEHQSSIRFGDDILLKPACVRSNVVQPFEYFVACKRSLAGELLVLTPQLCPLQRPGV